MQRAALALAIPVLFVLALTACEDGSTDQGNRHSDGTTATGVGGTTTAGTGTGGTGTGDYGVNTGIPCGQILDCNTLCTSGDQDCYDACFNGAWAPGQALYTALDTCFVENGCEDWSCLEVACADELAACEADIPTGGHICFAEGVYEVCDDYGYCDQYVAEGGGWGATEEYAGFWGQVDCNDHMLTMVIINSMNGTSQVISDCVTTSCGPNY